MTQRITCYVVFATIIWSAHTQNEEKDRADMFKSNMTRNDFSKLLSSLIKLNEQRVSVLQRLSKLEDYGVLSEVLRSGDKKLENGSPNNLFLIVMSKNETPPSRRQLDFEIVDTVKSLDVGGSKKVHPKLDYVLDPAGYISQKTNKKTSIKSIFENIPKVHGPKNTYLINDASKKNMNTIKLLKYRKPSQNAKERADTNILRIKKTGLRVNKEMKNRYENSKFEIPSKKGNDKTSQELQDYDENSKKYSPLKPNPPHYPKIYVPKFIRTKKSSSITYPLEAKDPQGGNEYGFPYSKKNINKSSNGQDAKRGISILNNQDSKTKYTTIKTDIKATTNKNDLRKTSTVNSENFTKMYSDTSIKKANDDKNPKPNINTDSPKISVQGNQSSQFNRSKSMLNPSNNYSTVMTEIQTTTNKNDLRIISTLNNSKTNTIDNYNKNSTFSLQHKDQEIESYYGAPFSKEYDEISQNRQNIKIDSQKIQHEQYPKLKKNESVINNESSTYSTIKAVIATSDPKNATPTFNTSEGDKATDNNYSEKPNLNIDLKQSKIKDENASKVIDHRDKFPLQATENPFKTEIPVTIKVLPYKNDTNKHNPKIVGNLLDGVNFGGKKSKNNTNRDNKNNLSRVMVIENIDGLTITTDPSLHLKDVTENTNKDKMKTAKHLNDRNKRKVESKQHKGHDTKKQFDDRGELIIDKKDGDDFSIIVTNVKKDEFETIKQPVNLRIDSNELNRPDGKPIERKAFQKCLNKKARKLCVKSCISAYKNVCSRLKCTSKAKKALKKECKRRCKNSFAASSSKYSDESSGDDSDSDDSDSDYS